MTAVGVDASTTESMPFPPGTTFSGHEGPVYDNPLLLTFLGAKMHLKLTTDEFGKATLNCKCDMDKYGVGWKQQIQDSVNGGRFGLPHWDPPGVGPRGWYTTGEEFDDNPGSSNLLDISAKSILTKKFTTTLHCLNSAQTKIATFEWSVQWEHKSDKYRVKEDWNEYIDSSYLIR